MAYCKYCGTNNSDASKFCTHCGSPMIRKTAPEYQSGSRMQQQEVRAAQQEEYTQQGAYAYQQEPQGAYAYQQAPQQETHAQQEAYKKPETYTRQPESTPRERQWQEGSVQTQGHWVLDTFLAGIPLIGLILLIVWSVTDQPDLSKQRWARAMLIWTIIGVIAGAAILTLFGALLYGLAGTYI